MPPAYCEGAGNSGNKENRDLKPVKTIRAGAPGCAYSPALSMRAGAALGLPAAPEVIPSTFAMTSTYEYPFSRAVPIGTGNFTPLAVYCAMALLSERRQKANGSVNRTSSIRRTERDRLTRTSKAAVESGVAERQVRLAEAQAEVTIKLIRNVLRGLGLSPAAPAAYPSRNTAKSLAWRALRKVRKSA